MDRNELQYSFGENQSVHFKIVLCIIVLHRLCVFLIIEGKTLYQ